jgi:hypothetical protein
MIKELREISKKDADVPIPSTTALFVEPAK